MTIGKGEDVDEGMDALGVQIKAKAYALKEAYARGIVGVNEGDKFKCGVGCGCLCDQKREYLASVAFSSVLGGKRDADGDAALLRCHKKHQSAEWGCVGQGDHKTLDLLVREQRVAAVLVDHALYMLA